MRHGVALRTLTVPKSGRKNRGRGSDSSYQIKNCKTQRKLTARSCYDQQKAERGRESTGNIHSVEREVIRGENTLSHCHK